MRNIRECVTLIQGFAREGQLAARLKKQAFGMDDDLGIYALSDDGLAFSQDSNVGDVHLKDFLESLELETLQRLQALMYSGRDKQSPRFVKAAFLKRSDTKEEIVRTIFEKRPSLETYFTRGLEQAQKENLDLDTF